MKQKILLLSLVICTYFAKANADTTENELSALKAVSSSSESFSNQLFKKFIEKNKGKNLVSSPLSSHILLSLIQQGAAGETSKQISEALHLSQENEINRQGTKLLMDHLNNVKGVTLELANSILISDQFSIKDDFKQLAKESFSSEASNLDFSKPKDSVNAINSWVDQKTHQKIKSIIKEGELSPDTKMLLLNTIYFKGNWSTPFFSGFTHKRNFHLDEKNNKEVDIMYVRDYFHFGELAELNAKFVELPYKNDQLKMVIIVPNEINGLKHIVEHLEIINQSRLAYSGSTGDLELSLPKFKIESEFDLKSYLLELGIKNMFANDANFQNISNEPIKVDQAVQKAFIEVTEEGTEAAVVTGARAVAVSLPLNRIIVDRPFLYKIMDNKSGATIFLGVVNDPDSL